MSIAERQIDQLSLFLSPELSTETGSAFKPVLKLKFLSYGKIRPILMT